MLTLTTLSGATFFVVAAFIQTIEPSPAGTSMRLHSGHWVECLEDPESVSEMYVVAMGLEIEEME